MKGFIPVLKIPGPTSHDVVAGVRRALGVKAGHLGTLDPAAAGVLVVALGGATRLTPYLIEHDKWYRAVIVLGAATDTADALGRVTRRLDASGIGEAAVRAAVAGLAGERMQVPPAASAVKVGGEELYKAFRRGVERAAPARRIVVHASRLVRWRPGARAEVTVDLHVSSGTYVRVLAEDVGRVLGVPAILGALLRVSVGPFWLDEAVTAEEAGRGEGLLPPGFPFAQGPRHDVTPAMAEHLRHGRPVGAASSPQGLSAAFSNGDLVAIGRRDDDLWRPVTVLSD